MMKYKTVAFKNFMSFGKQMVVVELNRPGITLITGKNGAGKSTITDAITFALFGKAFRKKATKNEIINEQNGKDCLVELDFETDDGTDWKIIRGIKPDRLEIWENGAPVESASGSKIDQTFINNNLLKISRAMFDQLIMMSKTGFKPFLDYTAPERRDFINRMLGLDLYTEMDKINSAKLSDLTRRKVTQSTKLQMTEKMINDLSEIKVDIVDTSMSIVQSLKRSIASRAVEYDDGYTIEAALAGEYPGPYVAQLEDVKQLQVDVEAATTQLNYVMHEGKRLSNQVGFLRNNDTCPTCEQVINPSWKVGKIEELEGQTSNLRLDYVKFKQQQVVLSTQLKANNEVNNKESNLASTINIINKEISRLVDDYRKEIELMQNKSVDVQSDDVKSKIKLYKTERAEYVKELEEINQSLRIIDYVTPLLKDNGIKKNIVREYIPLLNELISDTLSKMGLDMVFELTDTFDETITRFNGMQTKIHMLSEGQRLRVHLAVFRAWREIARIQGMTYSNFVFFDETFDSSLDPAGVESFINILREDGDVSPFIISHTPSKIDAQNRIHVEIEDGFSYFVK